MFLRASLSEKYARLDAQGTITQASKSLTIADKSNTRDMDLLLFLLEDLLCSIRTPSSLAKISIEGRNSP